MTFDTSFLASLADFGTVVNGPDLDPDQPQAFGRDREVELVLKGLADERRRSLVLLGLSGAGKTAVLREAARRSLWTDEAWAFLETSSSLLLAGTMYSGELETRVKRLLDAARRPRRVVVLFSDIYHLMGAGKTSKSDESIGSFLSPFIASGDLFVVGECNPDQFRQGVERYPSFRRLFQVLRIEEQASQAVPGVLRSVADQECQRLVRERRLRLEFPDEVLKRILELSQVYLADQAHPGKAIHLFEQVLAFERDAAGQQGSSEWVVPVESVIRALERFTGIPGLLLDDSQPLSLENVRRFLEERVLGQPDAIEKVVDLIALIKAGLTDPGKPTGVLFFVGPTGVGKTEMAKAIAEFIFGGPDRMIRFDMSEYKDYSAFEKLIGQSQAAEGSSLALGSLTTKLKLQPFSVVLFDEIEKAHSNVFDVFLQMFGEGRLTDARGQTVNCTQAIIVMTSNVGSETRQGTGLGFVTGEGPDPRDEVLAAMRRYFRPELLNRIDHVICFKALERDEMRKIAQRELGKALNRGGILRRNLRIDVDPAVIDVLLERGFSREYGARPLKRAVEELVLVPLAKQMIKWGETSSTGGTPAAPRPMLLRLAAADGRVVVRIVQDAESKQSEALARSVTLIDPVKKKKVKVTAGELSDQALRLEENVARLERLAADDQLSERKSELLTQTTRHGFWDDPEGARDVMTEIHRLEGLLDAVDRVRKRVDDLKRITAGANSRFTARVLEDLARRALDVEQHIEMVGYCLECRTPQERADAFVLITLIDAEPPEDDVVSHLAEMYANWARNKGFLATIFHEELAHPKAGREVFLLIEGTSVYGILRGEEGVHEMVYGRTSKEEKSSTFVRVRVLAVPDAEPREGESDGPAVDRQPAKGVGKLIKRYKSQVTATDPVTRVTLVARSGLEAGRTAQLMTELVQAENLRRQAAVAPRIDGVREPGSESVVRRYVMRPNSQAKDPETGVTLSGLDTLWNGALDAFLHARLEARREEGHRE